LYRARVVPDRFEVNTRCDVRVEVSSDQTMQVGTAFEVQFPNSWTMHLCASFTKQYQTHDPRRPEYLRAFVPGEDCEFDLRVEPRDFDTGDETSRHGRRIYLTLTRGAVPPGKPVTLDWRNTLSSRRAEVELVHVAVNGERVEPLPEIATMPGEAVRVRVIAPSSVAPGGEFQVRIVSLDAYDNCSRSWHEGDALLGPDGEPLTPPLSFHGSCVVTVTLREPGIARLEYAGVLSNPVRVADGPTGPYWGDTHIHTRWSHDAIGRFPYEYAREVSGLDFAAVCDHAESAFLGWETLVRMANEHNRDGSFVTLVAYENGLGAPSGHYNTYYRGGTGRCFLKRDFEGDIENLNLQLDPEDAMTIPHHTGIFWGHSLNGPLVHFEKLDERYSPVLEIYSHHGQSERYQPDHVNAYEFNRWHKAGERTNRSVPGHFAQDAWKMGKRLGVICSSDDHYGQGGLDFEGIAAVFAEELTREGIWQGIRARRCYGTTGARILLDLSVNGEPMGSELSCEPGQELEIRIEAHGTDALALVQLVALDLESGEYGDMLAQRPYELDFEGTVTEEFSGPAMYYLRVQQEKMINHRAVLAWSSPIWVYAVQP